MYQIEVLLLNPINNKQTEVLYRKVFTASIIFYCLKHQNITKKIIFKLKSIMVTR